MRTLLAGVQLVEFSDGVQVQLRYRERQNTILVTATMEAKHVLSTGWLAVSRACACARCVARACVCWVCFCRLLCNVQLFGRFAVPQIGRVADSQKNSMQGSDIVIGFTDGAEGHVGTATADGRQAPKWNVADLIPDG